MTHRTIAVDCDGVLADFTGQLMRRAHETWASDNPTYPKLPVEALHDRGWECLGTIHDYYSKTYEELSTLVKTPGFCLGIDPLPGAVAFFSAIKKLPDVEILIVTSAWSGPHWHHERLEWLHAHFGVRQKDVIFASKKQYVDADVLVDDKPENIIDWWKQQHRRGRHTYPEISCLPVFVMGPITREDNPRVLGETQGHAIMAPTLNIARYAIEDHWEYRGWK